MSAIDTTAFNTPIALDRDGFMRRLISSLGHLNEAVLGSDVAGAYIMNVGLSMGAAIEAEYKRFWQIERSFTLDEYSHVIVDLKQKIKGNFSLVSKDPEKVVVRTTSCPFDEFVRQSPALCFMTSSVFGGIAARNFGYAKVILHQRIALGDPGCYVTVYLRRTPEAEAAIGKEYFPEIDRASPDIVEQMRLMERVRGLRYQLSEANSRWEALVRGVADAICVISPDHVVIFANARWRDLLGLEGEELVGGGFVRLAHPEDQADVQGALDAALGGRRVVGQMSRLRHRDRSWRDVQASLGPVRADDGQVMGALVLLRDVTEEADARRLKDDFLSSASHELRTPVTTIRALTELLLHTIDRQGSVDPEQLTRRLQRILAETNRLALLGSDLLDAARYQAGKLAFKREPADLSEIVVGCIEHQTEISAAGDGRRIRFEWPGTRVPVSVERTRIEQVVGNLLDNAVKYSPGGGPISVRTAIDGDRGVVTVADQGIGIPERDMPSLFTPFFRGSNAPSRTFRGIGLGLYLSKAIAEVHGGALTAESRHGVGTAFTLALPLRGAEGD